MTLAVAPTCPSAFEGRLDGHASLDWTKKLPSHWRVERLRHVAKVQFSNVDKKSTQGESSVRLCNYVDVYYHDRITNGIAFMEATAEAREIERFGLAVGDVLVTKDSEDPHDICVPAVVAEPLPGVICGYHLAQIRPKRDRLDGPFLAQALGAHGVRDQFRMQANGITRFGLSQDAICDALVPLPPLSEQHAIAAFIDRRTRRIDELVTKKRRLIELLREKRAALINHVITKGLAPNASVRPSGISWLGDVPSHWDVVPLMYRTASGHRIMYGIVLPGPHFEGGVPIVKGGDVAPDRLRRELLRCTDPEIEAGYERSRLRGGDLVYAIRGSIGACELVPAECAGVNITQDTAKIAPHSSISGRWLMYVLKSSSLFAQLEAGALGATIRGINIRDLKRCRIPLPPLDEQSRIATHLDRVTAALDGLISAVSSGLDRVREHRQALISAAVTGRIDVRHKPIEESIDAA